MAAARPLEQALVLGFRETAIAVGIEAGEEGLGDALELGVVDAVVAVRVELVECDARQEPPAAGRRFGVVAAAGGEQQGEDGGGSRSHVLSPGWKDGTTPSTSRTLAWFTRGRGGQAKISCGA